MLTKTLAFLAFGGGATLGTALIGAQSGLWAGIAAAMIVVIFKRLLRRLMLGALVLGLFALALGLGSPPG